MKPTVKILPARAPHTCDVCGRTIPRGSYYVLETVWHPSRPVKIRHCNRCLGGKS